MRKTISSFLVALLLTSFLFVSAHAETIEGMYTLETNPECYTMWSFDTNTGVLTISGDRVDWNYSGCHGLLSYDGRYAEFIPVALWDDSVTPWNDYLDQITTVIINEGIKYIQNYAFFNCVNLSYISLPESLERIGKGVFANCPKITEVTSTNDKKMNAGVLYIPKNVSYIGNLFDYSPTLSSVDLNLSKYTWLDEDFFGTNYYNTLSNWNDGALYSGNVLLKVNKNFNGLFTVSDGTVVIASDAFYQCNSINEIIFPASVFTICQIRDASSLQKTVIYNPDANIGSNGDQHGTVISSCAFGDQNVIVAGYKRSTASKLVEASNDGFLSRFDFEHRPQYTFESMGHKPNRTLWEKIVDFFLDIGEFFEKLFKW